jgi:hypothetical protein
MSVGRAFGLRAPVVAVVVAAVVLVAPVPALAAGDASQASCPFETESSPGFRTYLPDCRAYELVTPPYKEGGVLEAEPAAISLDGERVITGVLGTFAGSGNDWYQGNRNPDVAVYEFARTAEGWQPTALTPPATQYPHSAIQAASAADDLQTTLWSLGTTTLQFNEDIYLREPRGTFAKVGPGVAPEVSGLELEHAEQELNLVGASADLTHSVLSIEARAQEGHSNLWPGDTTKQEAYSLYEYVRTGNVAPTLVGVSDGSTVVGGVTLPAGQVISRCGTELGSGVPEGSFSGGRDTYNAVSQDGETVFFTAHASTVGSPACDGPGEPAVNELYARIEQSKTVAISEPSLPAGECTSPEPCFGATPKEAIFQGASEDGERVFFLSEQPLVNGAPTTGVKLYEARLEGSTVSQLVDVSADPTSGQSPAVQGVVRVSENGERVYFVAKGVLSGEDKVAGREPKEAEPEAGADNLYVYEPDPAHPGTYYTVFVARMLTTPESKLLATPEESEESTLRTEESAEESRVDALAEERAERAGEEAVSHGGSFGEVYGEVEAREKEQLKGTLGPAGTLAQDTMVWGVADNRPAQATADGRFLLFSSSANLTPDDHSKVPQLFEYDALTEKLTRVSIGQGASFGDDGNVSTFREAAHISTQLFFKRDLPTGESFGAALAGDGSRVFFTSAARLAPQAVSGDTNVYEYREGNVYLVSDGHDASLYSNSPTVHLFGIDPSGRDAFFVTADPLVPEDGETQEALYDAREAGGFPAPLVSAGCTGETCRGAAGATPQLQLPGSAGQLAGGNVASPPPPPVSKPAVKPLTRAQKLAKALKACKKKPKRLRLSCERQARKSYGTVKGSAKKSNRRGK